MYCENCHKENPDNFDTCIYCGTSLQPLKKAGFLKSRNSLRNKITPIRVFSAFAAICIALALIFAIKAAGGREHPERTAKAYSLCIAESDVQSYLLLLDDDYRSFMINYKYYSEEALSSQLSSQLSKINEFYKIECGDDFSIKCKVTEVSYASQKSLPGINSYYKSKLMYKSNVDSAAKLRVVFEVKGNLGDYITVFDDFYCIKVNNNWYMALDFPKSSQW